VTAVHFYKLFAQSQSQSSAIWSSSIFQVTLLELLKDAAKIVR
jgi:hypothetical protein